MPTIKDIDDSGRDLRLWCEACQREGHIDAIIWMLFDERGWSMDMTEAGKRFRCKVCGARASSIEPCRRPPPPAGTPKTWAAEVERFFFEGRKKTKGR